MSTCYFGKFNMISMASNLIATFSHVCLCFVVIIAIFQVKCQDYNKSAIHHIFKDQFLDLLGNGTHVFKNKLQSYFSRRSWLELGHSNVAECLNNSVDTRCLLSKCLTTDDLLQITRLSEEPTDADLCTLSWMLFHMSEKSACQKTEDTDKTIKIHKDPTTTEVWGFGFLCTTVIVLCAIGGLLALPFIHGVNYRRVLIFMVGLAVGTLAGSGLLVLAPEALELTGNEMDPDSYLWKCLTMVGAIYAFFLLEKGLKQLTKLKERKREKKLRYQYEQNVLCRYGPRRQSPMPSVQPISISVVAEKDSSGNTIHSSDASPRSNSEMENNDNGLANDNSSQEKLHTTEKKHIAPVAWMILLGDAVHNLIDGVSIGAAFSESISAGVSVSVAVFCEELPHELGDFAVLLTAGMSKKRAAVSNILSACTIYIGMVIGIFLGEDEKAHTWVFAFAAGMFLYIALVDMMPELIAASESKENIELIGGGMIFFLQNLGILVGFGAILTLCIFGEQLDKSITSAQL